MRACWVLAAFVLAVCARAQDKGIEFDGVDLREAVRAIAKDGALDVLIVDAARGRVTATVDPSDPEAALRAIAGVKVVIDEGVAGRVTLRTTHVPWRHALQIIAESVGARVSREPDGTYRVRPGEKRQAFGGEYLAMSTTDERGLPMEEIAQILGVILEQDVRLDPEVMAAGASVVIDGLRCSKQQFAELLCNCCQLDMVELASGAVELRYRTDG